MDVNDHTTTRNAANFGGSDAHASAASGLIPLVNNGIDPRSFAVYGDSAEGAVVDRAPVQGQDMEGNGALNAKISTEHKDIRAALRSTGVANAETNPLDSENNVRPPTDVASQVRGLGIETDACQASSNECESLLTPKETTFSSSKKDGAKSATRARNGSPKKRGRKTARTNRNKSFIRTASACEEVRAASSAYEEAATAVEKAEEAVRKRKGKGKEMELPTSESASTGSKRRHDDVTELPSGPGPSRPVTRRMRARIQDPSASAQPTRRSTRIPELVAQGKIRTTQVSSAGAPVMRNRPVRQAQNTKRKRDTDEDNDEVLELHEQCKKQRLAVQESQEYPASRSQITQHSSSSVASRRNTTPSVDAIRVKLRDHEKDIRLSAIRYTLRFRRWTDPLEDVVEIEGVASTSDVPNKNDLDNTRSESQPSPSNETTIKEIVPTTPAARHASPSSEDEVETLLLVQDGRESTPTPGSPGSSTSPRPAANIPEDAVVIDLTGDTPIEFTRPRQKGRQGPRGGQRKRQRPQNNGWYHSPPPDETGRQRLAPEPSDGLIEAMRNGWTYGCRSPAYSRYTKYKIW